jgi:hypothetical protein
MVLKSAIADRGLDSTRQPSFTGLRGEFFTLLTVSAPEDAICRALGLSTASIDERVKPPLTDRIEGRSRCWCEAGFPVTDLSVPAPDFKGV